MALSWIPGYMLPVPGYCIICGSTGVDCVDSGVSKQFYGALLICKVCFRDGALRIPELELCDRVMHENIVEELSEKIEWRKSLEPTVAKLELDLANALSNARRGFSQRYIADSTFAQVQFRASGDSSVGTETIVKPGEAEPQLFYSLEELGQFTGDQRQDNDNVGDERPIGVSSSSGDAG